MLGRLLDRFMPGWARELGVSSKAPKPSSYLVVNPGSGRAVRRIWAKVQGDKKRREV
jgi:hypothetical protein